MSNPLTSPAIFEEKSDASKRVIRVIPDFPAMTFSHASETVLPTGEIMPNPVMATLRLDKTTPMNH